MEELIGVDVVRMLDGLGMTEQFMEAASPGAFVTYAEEDPAALTADTFVETDIVLTLDSGCCDHIVDLADAPGYNAVLEPSPGSLRKQRFVVGNGSRVPKQGQDPRW